MKDEKIIVAEANTEDTVPTIEDNGITYKLTQPFTWEGKTYTHLDLDFGSLRGKDMEQIEEEIISSGESLQMIPEMTSSYLFKVAAKAAGVHHSVIENLPFTDALKVKIKARNFILRGLGNETASSSGTETNV